MNTFFSIHGATETWIKNNPCLCRPDDPKLTPHCEVCRPDLYCRSVERVAEDNNDN